MTDTSNLETRFLSETESQTNVIEPTLDRKPSPLLLPGVSTKAPDITAILRPSPNDKILPPAANPNAFEPNMTEKLANNKPSPTYELTPEDRAAIAEEQKRILAKQPIGPPVSISVFGSAALTGRKFVFVVDRSQSMGASGLGVLHLARTELHRAIQKLKPHHQFQVVAYNDRTTLIQSRKLLPATEANKKSVLSFFDRLAAHGPTEHFDGLVAALAFRPDVVVLLTDGGHPFISDANQKTINRMLVKMTITAARKSIACSLAWAQQNWKTLS